MGIFGVELEVERYGAGDREKAAADLVFEIVKMGGGCRGLGRRRGVQCSPGCAGCPSFPLLMAGGSGTVWMGRANARGMSWEGASISTLSRWRRPSRRWGVARYTSRAILCVSSLRQLSKVPAPRPAQTDGQALDSRP